MKIQKQNGICCLCTPESYYAEYNRFHNFLTRWFKDGVEEPLYQVLYHKLLFDYFKNGILIENTNPVFICETCLLNTLKHDCLTYLLF